MSELESRELRDNILDGLNATFQKLVKEKKRTNSELAFVQNGKLVLGAVVVDRLLISVPEPGQAVALPAGGEGECVEDHRQKQ